MTKRNLSSSLKLTLKLPTCFHSLSVTDLFLNPISHKYNQKVKPTPSWCLSSFSELPSTHTHTHTPLLLCDHSFICVFTRNIFNVIQSVAVDIKHSELLWISWKFSVVYWLKTHISQSKVGVSFVLVVLLGYSMYSLACVKIHEAGWLRMCIRKSVCAYVCVLARAVGFSFGSVLVYSQPETLAQ